MRIIVKKCKKNKFVNLSSNYADLKKQVKIFLILSCHLTNARHKTGYYILNIQKY